MSAAVQQFLQVKANRTPPTYVLWHRTALIEFATYAALSDYGDGDVEASYVELKLCQEDHTYPVAESPEQIHIRTYGLE